MHYPHTKRKQLLHGGAVIQPVAGELGCLQTACDGCGARATAVSRMLCTKTREGSCEGGARSLPASSCTSVNAISTRHCVRVAAARPVHRLSARVSSQELDAWPMVRATSLVALALAYPL
jgi:hypothetical protein